MFTRQLVQVVFFPECTSPKTNIDTQNDGLEKVGSFKL